MDEIDKFAADFRAALIPTVAKKVPWAKMTPESQQSYREGMSAAIKSMIEPAARVARAEIAMIEADNAALVHFIEQQGFSMHREEDGTVTFASMG